jgi:ribosomal protein S18 acetylase RimI-like enzyme/catechol 2,3-dioxygenase-like lactoylglutathione lyase family enzyme
MLVPELDVTALAASLPFYVDVLEFRVLFERPAERFAYIERDGVELMLQEAAGPGRRFRTAPLERPHGRGVNFQLRVENVDAVHARAVAAGAAIVVPMEERWYRGDVAETGGRWQTTGPVEVGNRQFVLADPDGYLWRPFRDLGARTRNERRVVRPSRDHLAMNVIRPARPDDGAVLREIERRAGERFRDVDLPEVADHEPASVDELACYAEEQRSWVLVDDTDEPIGYVLVDVVDGCAHIEQVSVRPEHQGSGLGGLLVEHVRTWAGKSGLSAVTLTTFSDVAWNMPLYEHLGFRVLSESEIGPELREVRDKETAQGLDPAKRVCMRWELTC